MLTDRKCLLYSVFPGTWFVFRCRIFLSLMEEAGLSDLLKQEGSYTIFAPTDEAFDGLTPEDFELLKSEHPAKIHPSVQT